MPSSTICFKHRLGDRVKLLPLEGLQGVVDSMAIGDNGVTYRVVYWSDSKRCVEWVRGDEIA